MSKLVLEDFRVAKEVLQENELGLHQLCGVGLLYYFLELRYLAGSVNL